MQSGVIPIEVFTFNHIYGIGKTAVRIDVGIIIMILGSTGMLLGKRIAFGCYDFNHIVGIRV